MVLKSINYNKFPSPTVSSTPTPLYFAQRPLSFKFVSPNARFYIPNWRKFSIDFKKKVNNNIQSQLPLSKHKGLRGVSDSTKRRCHFEILITPMWLGFNEGHENDINFIKKVTFTTSHFKGFFKGSVKISCYNTQNMRDTKRSLN